MEKNSFFPLLSYNLRHFCRIIVFLRYGLPISNAPIYCHPAPWYSHPLLSSLQLLTCSSWQLAHWSHLISFLGQHSFPGWEPERIDRSDKEKLTLGADFQAILIVMTPLLQKYVSKLSTFFHFTLYENFSFTSSLLKIVLWKLWILKGANLWCCY